LKRDYHAIQADIAALLALDLIAKTPEGVAVPWDAVEWRLTTIAQVD